MKLVSVNIGAARPTPGRKSAKTGIYKLPVDHPVMIGREGLAGDRIVNARLHGGPDQAVYIESEADLGWWAQELGRDIEPGTFGENLTISGFENRDLAVGDRFQIGEVVLEMTSARTPCATFAARMGDPFMVKRYFRAGRPGAYARVIREGIVRGGDPAVLIRFGGERIGMRELMLTHGERLQGEERERYLAAPISERLRAFLVSAPQ